MSVIKIKRYKLWRRLYDSWIYGLFHPVSYFKNRRLISKYPFLMPRGWNEKKPDHYHYQWTLLDGLCDGWRKAFGRMMLDDLMEACKRDEIDPKSLYIVEIKEKWGMMRLSLNNVGYNLQYVIDAYEEVSGNICCKCGKIDVPMTNFGWMLPLCQDCYVSDNRSAKKYEEMLLKKTADECRIPDYYTILRSTHNGSQYVNIDLTWITDRLRKENK